MQIDTRIIIEDIIKVRRTKEKKEESKRKKRDRYKERDMDTLVDTVTFKKR